MRQLPLGIADFSQLQYPDAGFEAYAYVDKTPLIAQLAQSTGHLFLVRPRRFGKTLLVSTLQQLFQGNRQAFRDTWMDQSDHWDWTQTYPVLRLDMDMRNIHDPTVLEQALQHYLWQLAGDAASEIYADQYRTHQGAAGEINVEFSIQPDRMLTTYIHHLAARHPRNQIVVLVDEYDMPINENLDRPCAEDIVDVMRAFYGALKRAMPQIRFTLVTGITRFARTGLFSGANHLTDISHRLKYNALLGITQAELEHGVLREHVQASADNLGVALSDMYAALRQRYNGYRFFPHGEAVYNPFSLLHCLDLMADPDESPVLSLDRLPNYWAESGHTSLLQRLPAVRSGVIAWAGGAPASITDVSHVTYDVRQTDITALLYQAGYLTYRMCSLEGSEDETFLDFPNQEVQDTFEGPLRQWLRNQLPTVADIQDPSSRLSPLVSVLHQAWTQRDMPALCQALNQYLRLVPYPLHPVRDQAKTILDYEFFYQAVLYGPLQLLGLQSWVEVPLGRGRTDLMVTMADDHICLVEIKLNDRADRALRQVLARDYMAQCARDGLSVTAMGINIDTHARRVTECVKWELGRCDLRTGRWEHEPFALPLQEWETQPEPVRMRQAWRQTPSRGEWPGLRFTSSDSCKEPDPA